MAFCSFAVSALLRRVAFFAGFLAAAFFAFGADFTAIAFFVLGLFADAFAADFFFAFRAMELAALSEGAELVGGLLSALAVGGQFIGDSLVLPETTEARTLHGTDVDEHVLCAVIRLNETIAFGLVEPLYLTCSQDCSRFRV